MTESGHRFSRYFATRNRLGQVLVDLGLLDQDQLWDVLEGATSTGQLTGQVAVARGIITNDQLLQALAEQARLQTES